MARKTWEDAVLSVVRLLDESTDYRVRRLRMVGDEVRFHVVSRFGMFYVRVVGFRFDELCYTFRVEGSSRPLKPRLIGSMKGEVACAKALASAVGRALERERKRARRRRT